MGWVLESVCSLLEAQASGNPITAFLPEVVYLLEQIRKVLCTTYGATNLANRFLAISVRKEDQQQFALAWNGQSYSFTVLPQVC